MDKITLENYEFLSTDDDNGQFFLVQDDGTYLLNKTEDQLVTPEEGDQCAVFDVSQSHFLVDGDGTQTDLVTVPEGFVLPESITQEVYKPETVPEDNLTEQQQQNNCTEITLTDEQYQLLEKNGWVLLESNDKIWMLDSSGIQDITSNLELIQQLKALLQNSPSGEIKATSSRSILRTDFTQPLVDVENSAHEEQQTQDIIELVFDNDSVQLETAGLIQTAGPDDQVTTRIDVDGTQCTDTDVDESHRTKSRSVAKHARNQRNIRPPLCNPLKLKTEYFFKDIPHKMILGKTVNGKNLVARVKTIITNPYSKPVNIVEASTECNTRLETPVFKRKDDVKNNSLNKEANIADKDVMAANKCVIQPSSKIIGTDIGKPMSQTRWYNASHVKKLPVYKRGRSPRVWSSGDDDCGETMFNQAIAGTPIIDHPGTGSQEHKAQAVAAQLIRVPSLISMIKDANLIITKAVRCGEKQISGGESSSLKETCILTGSISIGDDLTPQFHYIPGIIKKLAEEHRGITESFSVDHIHITETQYDDKDDAICVTLNEKFISTNILDLACHTCNEICTTAAALDRHQETHEMDSEDTLTIDDPEKDNDVSEPFQKGEIKLENNINP